MRQLPNPNRPINFSTRLRSFICLSMAPTGLFAAIYAGSRLLGYLGPIDSLYDVIGSIFIVALAWGGTAYELVRKE